MAVVGACVGHLETDGVEHYLNVTEKRNRQRRKILLDAARPVLAYLERAGIDPDRLGGRGIGVHSLRKTAINDAIRNGASLHEVREFAGHADIRTTEIYFVRKEEDAEVAARRIQIRVTGRKLE